MVSLVSLVTSESLAATLVAVEFLSVFVLVLFVLVLFVLVLFVHQHFVMCLNRFVIINKLMLPQRLVSE